MKQFRNAFLAATLALFAAANAFADATAAKPALNTAAIDEAVTKSMAELNIPGVALGIVYKGELRYAKGYGKANVEKDAAVTPDTVFMIASVSKPILALGIARLAEQGKLKLDDPISKHLPNTPDTWKDIRLTQLMNHTAGLVRESPAFEGGKIKPDFEVVSAAYSVPLVFPTGTGMQYCNVCYFALAEVITRVSGQPWAEFMEREVFQRAGMKDTRPTSQRDMVPGRALSYERLLGIQKVASEYTALRPSGAFMSTVNDLARLEAALHANKLVTADTWKKIEAPSRIRDEKSGDSKLGKMRDGAMGYGMGWELSELEGMRRVAHGGSLAGFRTMYARYPDQGWAVIVLANSATARPGAIENAVAKLLPKP